jgi:CRISPR/Cas system-associated exonuclease Cas4 (RecB family)
MHLLYDCPRCFYLEHVAGIRRIRGIFPGLPGAIDKLLQVKTAKLAGKSRPSWLLPGLKGGGIIKQGKKRMITKGKHFVLTGIVDDLIVTDSGSIIIVDYKTASHPHSKEDTVRYYALQLDMYAFLCEANGFHVEDTAYIVYTTPDYLMNFADSFGVNFKVTHIALEVHAQRARDTIAEAIAICMLKEAPPASADCEYCQYHNQS